MINFDGNVLNVMEYFVKLVREEHGIGKTTKLSVRDYEKSSEPTKIQDLRPGGTQEEMQSLLKQMNGFASLDEMNAWSAGDSLKEELAGVMQAYTSTQVGGELFSLSNDNQAACSALLKRLASMNKYEKTEAEGFDGTSFDVAGFYKELENMFYAQFEVKDGAEAVEMSGKTAAAMSQSQVLATKLQSDLSPENALILLQDRAY